MHTLRSLPDDYELQEHIDLQKNKKLALIVNLGGIAVAATMVLVMHIFVPISSLFDIENGLKNYTLRFVVFIVANIVYIIMHELTHAVFMKHYGAEKIKFGFTGIYAYAGYPDGYFDNHSYIRISLAPLVIWGIVFTALCILLRNNHPWLWVVYFLQIANVSGAAGDILVSIKTLRYPDDVYVMDDGLTMSYFTKNTVSR